MRQAGDLLADPADDRRGTGADRRDGDAGGEVDQVIAVDVDEMPPPARLDEDRKGRAEARGQGHLGGAGGGRATAARDRRAQDAHLLRLVGSTYAAVSSCAVMALLGPAPGPEMAWSFPPR